MVSLLAIFESPKRRCNTNNHHHQKEEECQKEFREETEADTPKKEVTSV